VAHHEASGKRRLLDVARKLADHIDSVFGPGRRLGYSGHPEIEIAPTTLSIDLVGSGKLTERLKN